MTHATQWGSDQSQLVNLRTPGGEARKLDTKQSLPAIHWNPFYPTGVPPPTLGFCSHRLLSDICTAYNSHISPQPRTPPPNVPAAIPCRRWVPHSPPACSTAGPPQSTQTEAAGREAPSRAPDLHPPPPPIVFLNMSNSPLCSLFTGPKLSNNPPWPPVPTQPPYILLHTIARVISLQT